MAEQQIILKLSSTQVVTYWALVSLSEKLKGLFRKGYRDLM